MWTSLPAILKNDPAPIDCDSLAASLKLMESYEEKKAATDDFTELDKRIIPLLYGRPIFPEPAVNTRNSSGAKFPGR